MSPARHRVRRSDVKRLFGALWAVGGMLVVLVFAATSSIPIYPFAFLPRGKRERYTIWGARYFAWGCLHPVLFIRDQIIGRENLPQEGGYLVVSNHRSWLDVALLILHTRSQGVSKKEVAWIPFFGLNGWLSGAIFFDRRSKDGRGRVVSDTLQLLAGGANVHVFPEGTRTRDGRLSSKAHLRLVQAAAQADRVVVPCCTWGTERGVPASGIYAMPFQSMGLQIGEPMRRAPEEASEAFAERVWAQVTTMARARGADAPFRAEA